MALTLFYCASLLALWQTGSKNDFFSVEFGSVICITQRNHSDNPTFWQVLCDFFNEISVRGDCRITHMHNSLIITADWCLSTGNMNMNMNISECNS